MVHPSSCCFLTYNGLYDATQYECPKLDPYFSFNCRISFIPDDLRISRNVEQNNVFDDCGCFICHKNQFTLLFLNYLCLKGQCILLVMKGSVKN